MNIFNIFWFIIILKIRCDDYEKILLVYESNNYYIPVKLSQNTGSEYYIFSNILPINFFPSSKCSICKSYQIDINDKSYSFIKNNVSVPYYSLIYSGDLYKSNVTLGKQINSLKFIAFDSISYTKSYIGKGRFSLSFLNYFFNTTKKIFALSLKKNGGELDLGGYNTDKIKNISNLSIFNIAKTNYNDIYEYQNYWYIDFNHIQINGKNIQNNDNKFKLTLDISTNNFHIPKDFFFNNAHLIFSPDSKCQVQPEGYFLCICNSDYKKKFGNFQFTDENNNTLDVKVTDYIGFDDSETGNYCYVSIEINYESDLFIAGKYVMNNYYTIFDIDNSQLKIYPDGSRNFTFEQISVIIFLFLLCIAGLIFICCYIIYHKFCKRNQNAELNENLVQDNQQEEGNVNEEEMNQQQDIDGNIENNYNNNNGNNDDNEEENLDNEKKVLSEYNIYDNNNNIYNGNEEGYSGYSNNNIDNINYNVIDNCINDIRNSYDNL
jgi:hypothetical protein